MHSVQDNCTTRTVILENLEAISIESLNNSTVCYSAKKNLNLKNLM